MDMQVSGLSMFAMTVAIDCRVSNPGGTVNRACEEVQM